MVDLPNCMVFGKPQTLRGKVVKAIRPPTFQYTRKFDKFSKQLEVVHPTVASAAAPSSSASDDGSENAAYEVKVFPRKKNQEPKVEIFPAVSLRRRRKDGFSKDVLKVMCNVLALGAQYHEHTI